VDAIWDREPVVVQIDLLGPSDRNGPPGHALCLSCEEWSNPLTIELDVWPPWAMRVLS
jgi:hypothetical protein